MAWTCTFIWTFGCFFATTLFQLLLVVPLKEVREAHPSVQLRGVAVSQEMAASVRLHSPQRRWSCACGVAKQTAAARRVGLWGWKEPLCIDFTSEQRASHAGRKGWEVPVPGVWRREGRDRKRCVLRGPNSENVRLWRPLFSSGGGKAARKCQKASH